MRQQGFSSVELLITLFVAAAFVITGYQLYSVLIDHSGSSQAQAIANNFVYDEVKKAAATAPSCPATPDITTTTPSINLLSPTLTTTISAPNGCPWDGGIMKVQISLDYTEVSGKSGRVTHAVFVER